MIFRNLAVVIFSFVFLLIGFLAAPKAEALTQIQISNLSYQDCPEEYQGGLLSYNSEAANCFMVTGEAKNNSQPPN